MRKKTINIFLINILIFCILFFILDDIIYRYDASLHEWHTPKKYNFLSPRVFETDIEAYGRKSEFENTNSDKTPIILFGCSFAYGQYLNYQQTFGYKLSQILNRPVINRALIAGGLPHMYYQTKNEKFYTLVPPSDNIIYIMIKDHTRRMMVYTFFINLNILYIHYNFKNNKFISDNYKNPILNFLKSLYIVKLINHKYAEIYINNSKNADKITDIELMYFIKTRENLEKHWKIKVKFTVILYDYIMYEKMLKEKLEKNGFNVIDIKEFKNGAINQARMLQTNHHPTEEAWDYFTPMIAEKIPQ